MECIKVSRPELDLRPEINSGLPGLNLGHRVKVNPTWAFPLCISENTKTFLNQNRGRGERLSNFVIKDI